MGIERKQGEVLYCTYYLIFPHDKDVWCKQTPIVHNIDFWLKNTVMGKDPQKARDILTHGETRWKDSRGVTHRVVIEREQRPQRWGMTMKEKFIARTKRLA